MAFRKVRRHCYKCTAEAMGYANTFQASKGFRGGSEGSMGADIHTFQQGSSQGLVHDTIR